MLVDAMIRAAAVGGVASMWCYFTLKAFKICKEIVFPPKIIHTERCEYCGIYFPYYDGSRRWEICQAIYVCKSCAEKEVVCENYQERFFDDDELEIRYGDEKGDKPLCKNCISAIEKIVS